MKIYGTVAPGFEAVKNLYEHNMRTLAERDSQLCIYVGEQCVVDLWATANRNNAFNGDSLINVFSSGKSLEAILLAMLCDRGLLNYEANIIDYWPEFAAKGKSNLTVADLMRHEAGLAAFDTSLEPRALLPENICKNSIGKIIENQDLRFSHEQGAREYHAATRGWIANEIFRRIEPKGRTMGQFLREEISEPMGLDVFIGLKDSQLSRVYNVTPLGIGFQLWQSFIPKKAGRKIEFNLLQLFSRICFLITRMRKRASAGRAAPLANTKTFSLFDSPELNKGETPSAGAKCSARGLAKLAAVMANEGRFKQHQILGPRAHAALHAKPIKRPMTIMQTTFTQGGLAHFTTPNTSASDGLDRRPHDMHFDTPLNQGRQGFYGWFGLGGSIFQWHPKYKIGFAYIPTSLNILDVVNERGKCYQAAVVSCVQALQDSSRH